MKQQNIFINQNDIDKTLNSELTYILEDKWIIPNIRRETTYQQNNKKWKLIYDKNSQKNIQELSYQNDNFNFTRQFYSKINFK